MTFFSAPDDASAAHGSLNAITDFWARAFDPKMFGLNGNEAAQAAEAFWTWPIMVNRAMTDALAMWGGSFGALCVPGSSAAKVAPAKVAPEKAPPAPKVSPKVAVKPAVAKKATAAAAKVVTETAAPVLELPPVILAEVAPAPAITLPVPAAPAASAAAAPVEATPAATDKVTPAAPVAAATAEATAALAATVAAIEPEDFQRPKRIEKPKAVDDLKMISGVGPKIEKTLHGLGIYTFAQVAGWTPAEIAWVDDYVSFQGRIVRDDWLGQAAALARGGRDEYVRVYGKEPR